MANETFYLRLMRGFDPEVLLQIGVYMAAQALREAKVSDPLRYAQKVGITRLFKTIIEELELDPDEFARVLEETLISEKLWKEYIAKRARRQQ